MNNKWPLAVYKGFISVGVWGGGQGVRERGGVGRGDFTDVSHVDNPVMLIGFFLSLKHRQLRN